MIKEERHPSSLKLALRFLSWFCPAQLYEEIEGDLIERFTRDVKAIGECKAKRKLIWNAVRFLRPGIVLRNKFSVELNQWHMILNYFSISFRTIRRNWTYSSLNIIGLALGMAAFLFILQYVAYEKSYDRFHHNHENIYRVAYSYTYFKNGITTKTATAPPRVVSFMKEIMPEVKSFTRVRHFPGIVVSYNKTKFRQDKVLIVDPEFVKIFDFPLISGNPKTALNDIRTVVISESAAKKYFGDQPALGKIIGVDGNENYTITGVAKDAPSNSHLQFDFLISYETVKWWTGGDAETSWWFNHYYEYVLLEPGTNITSFNQKFAKAFERERGKINQEESSKQEFYLQPLVDIHLHSKLDQELNPDLQGDSEAVFFLTIIAFFILLIAWINYINLFTARATDRAKEVGVRKTIGALQSQLIGQFMTESFVMNCMAVVIALALVAVGLPYFNLITDSSLSLDFLSSISFWENVFIFIIAGSIISGLYPSLVLSSYRPSVVLKGKFSIGTSGILIRRVLVVFQFASSVVLIAGTMVVYMQLDHMKTTNLGFDMNQLMVVRGPGVTEEELSPAYQKRTDAFINELLRFSEIKSVAGGSTIPGKEIPGGVIIKKKENPESMFKFVQATWIGYDYFSTLGIKLLAGRSFSPEMRADSLSLVLNASAVKALGFASPEEAVGQKISVGVQQVWTLIGVIDDYKQMSLHGSVKPMFFHLYTVYSPLFVYGTKEELIPI